MIVFLLHRKLNSENCQPFPKIDSVPLKRAIKKCLIIATALGLGLLPARTWTSADGSKTFEGKLKSYDDAGGKVTVTATCSGDIRSIKIDPQIIDPEDSEILEDLILSGVTQAIEQGRKVMEEELSLIHI